MIQCSFGKVRAYPEAVLFNEEEVVTLHFGQAHYHSMRVPVGTGCTGCALNVPRLKRACEESQALHRCSERVVTVYRPRSVAAEVYNWDKEIVWHQESVNSQ